MSGLKQIFFTFISFFLLAPLSAQAERGLFPNATAMANGQAAVVEIVISPGKSEESWAPASIYVNIGDEASFSMPDYQLKLVPRVDRQEKQIVATAIMHSNLESAGIKSGSVEKSVSVSNGGTIALMPLGISVQMTVVGGDDFEAIADLSNLELANGASKNGGGETCCVTCDSTTACGNCVFLDCGRCCAGIAP